MSGGLVSGRVFHRPWAIRVAALGVNLLVIAFIVGFGTIKGWFHSNGPAVALLGSGLALMLTGCVRRMWWLIRPRPLLIVDGYGVRYRQRNRSMGAIPWGRLQTAAGEGTRVIGSRPPQARPDDAGAWYCVLPGHLQEPQSELTDALGMRGDYAEVDAPEDGAPTDHSSGAADPVPTTPLPRLEAPGLEIRRRLLDGNALMVRSVLPLGYLLAFAGGLIVELGAVRGATMLTTVLLLILGAMGGTIYRTRLPARVHVGAAGIHTTGYRRGQALDWDSVLAIAEIRTSGEQEFIGLFHRQDPAPPVLAAGTDDENPEDGLPPFELFQQLLPDVPATGWCLLETSDLRGDHAETLRSCRQGLAWHQSLNPAR